MATNVIIKGRFLCTKNYFKKDKAGNVTTEVVKQILVFDGEGAVKITDVDGSKMQFGDVVEVPCTLYTGDYGSIFRAITT